MKNKRAIYILLPVVFGIWGLVLYEFVSFGTAEEIVPEFPSNSVIQPLTYKEPQKIIIETNYRDPFLGTPYVPVTPVTQPKNYKKPVKVKTIPELVWPPIQYKGVLSDVKEKKKTFLLIINGKNYFMSIGDTANGIFLKAGDKESVYVIYQGELNLIMLAE
ncbi:hypothetical protein ACNQGB_02225 [Flavobacterium sp. XS1P32]|uniref:hypothetical protein n=1 Tax=Flavobacterium sp. XS1P32 TaxID=3401726 RepID=UPI003AAAF732